MELSLKLSILLYIMNVEEQCKFGQNRRIPKRLTVAQCLQCCLLRRFYQDQNDIADSLYTYLIGIWYF